MRDRSKRLRTRCQRVAVHALATIVAVATLFVGASSGLDYLWCAPMEQARAHCCCPAPTREEAAHDRIGVQCCEVKALGTLASGVTHTRDRVVFDSPLVAILPLAQVFDAPVFVSAIRRAEPREARAGPRQRPHALHSVYLI